MTQSVSTSRTHRRGMTLVELLLALMITAMIGLTIASVISAVAYGTDSSRDMRSLVARNKALNARITATIRSAIMVLDEGDDFLILWSSDLDEDGEPSLLEIQRVDYDSSSDEISSYVAPDSTTDVYYTLSTNFETTTDSLMGTASFPEEVWATGVSSWTIALDETDPQDAALVSYQIELTADSVSDTAIAAVSMRN